MAFSCFALGDYWHETCSVRMGQGIPPETGLTAMQTKTPQIQERQEEEERAKGWQAQHSEVHGVRGRDTE